MYHPGIYLYREKHKDYLQISSRARILVCVCVFVCVRACVRARARVCVRVRAFTCEAQRSHPSVTRLQMEALESWRALGTAAVQADSPAFTHFCKRTITRLFLNCPVF